MPTSLSDDLGFHVCRKRKENIRRLGSLRQEHVCDNEKLQIVDEVVIVGAIDGSRRDQRRAYLVFANLAPMFVPEVSNNSSDQSSILSIASAIW